MVRRLALPRYLAGEANRLLSKAGPYSGGLATSLLQDAAEAMLLILAQESSISLRGNAPFPALLQQVGEAHPVLLGHKAPMNSLNKARVAFKHQGISISKEDAIIFAANGRSFLSDATEVFGIDFWSVSLADLVGHCRTQNWLRRAELFVSEEKYREALTCAANAAAVYLHYRCNLPMGFEQELYAIPTGGAPLHLPRGFSVFDDDGPDEFRERVKESLNRLQTHLILIARGIDIADYRKFQAITPHVTISGEGTLVSTGAFVRQYPVLGVKDADALFGISFVVEMALRLQETAPHNEGMSAGPLQTHVATPNRKCEVIVHPRESQPEVIREAAPGEGLTVIGDPGDPFPEHAEILQDHQPAYVLLSCVDLQEVDPPGQ